MTAQGNALGFTEQHKAIALKGRANDSAPFQGLLPKTYHMTQGVALG